MGIKKLFILLLMLPLLSCSQTRQTEDYQILTYEFMDNEIRKLSGDISITLFGNENLVKVGTLSEGLLSVDLSQIIMTEISDKTIGYSLGDVTERLFFGCESYRDDLSKIQVAQSGSFLLIQDGVMVAELFAVTDEKIENWLLSSGHEPSVKSSFLEVVYSDSDAVFSTDCKNYNDKEEVYQHHSFDLNLKKGFNMIEYRIEEIGLPDGFDFIIPVKTTTTNKNINYKN